MTDLLADLADTITALVDPYTTTEMLDLRSSVPGFGTAAKIPHKVTHPSLLDQLARAVTAGGAGDHGRSHPESTPVADLDVIDVLTTIRGRAFYWTVFHQPWNDREALGDAIRRLVGRPWDDDQLVALVRDAERWLTAAQIATGWETRPWTPNVPCPSCNTRGTLKIRDITKAGYATSKVARCSHCGSRWDDGTIGLLAEMIRTAGVREQPPRPRPLVVVDPVVNDGLPSVLGVRLEEIAAALLTGKTVPSVAEEFGIMRADVIVACWYLGRYSRPWRGRLHIWAIVAGEAMAKRADFDRIPDPPLGPNVTNFTDQRISA